MLAHALDLHELLRRSRQHLMQVSEMVQKIVDQDKKDEFLAGKFHFYRAEGEGDERLLTFMYPQDGQMMGVNVGMHVYQDCSGILERNPQIRPAEGFSRIDADWLASKLA
jgi:hypothetical protein